MSRAVRHLAAVAALFLALAPAAMAADDKAADETPSEKVRKALDQPIDLDLKESSLAKAVDRFREKTKLDITIDRTTFGLLGGGVIDPTVDQPLPIQGKFKGTKVRDALRKAFEPHGLAPFVVDDAVLLTSEEAGLQKQLKQRVDVDVDDVPLGAALKQLGRRKAVNLVVDQKMTKQAEKKVSLQVEDVALETAVRLLAEQAGLKAARVDNVLYVTTPEQAASIAADNRALMPYSAPYLIYGMAGAGGLGGAIGALGIGAGGVFGAVGLGGLGGAGGGLVGFGGFRVMPAPPLPGGAPPTPPPPDKPNESRPQSRRAAPQTTPAVAAADRPGVPPPTTLPPPLWARAAARPTVGARRTRRRAPSPEPRLS
jgi:hypothetical protein